MALLLAENFQFNGPLYQFSSRTVDVATGWTVCKPYDTAQTPYQRLLASGPSGTSRPRPWPSYMRPRTLNCCARRFAISRSTSGSWRRGQPAESRNRW